MLLNIGDGPNVICREVVLFARLFVHFCMKPIVYEFRKVNLELKL